MATTKTELLNNGVVVATKTASPFYSWDWTPATSGASSLTYKRYEDNVLVYTSGAITGTVDASTSGVTPSHYWGVRKRNANYTGDALEMRRASDSVLFNVGFSGNDLDVASYSTNIASGSAYLRTLKDQYGTVDLLQAIDTTSRQPLLYNSGVTEEKSGKPTIKFPGTQVQLVGDASVTAVNGITIFIVHSNTSTTGSNKGILGKTGADTEYAVFNRHFSSPNDISAVSATSSDFQTNTQSGVILNTASTKLITVIIGGGRQKIKVNGVQVADDAIGGVKANTNLFVLGGYKEASSFTDIGSNVSEVTIYKQTLGASDISAEEVNINAYYNIY